MSLQYIILPCTGLGYSRTEGFDFVFIHCGCNEGRTVSVHWINKDEFSIRTIASADSEDGGVRSTRAQVKLWDIGNGIFDRLFEVAGVIVARLSPNG